MKKLNLAGMFGLLALFSVCLFTSCSDDDDEGGSASELVGTWQSTYSTYWEKRNGTIIYSEDEEEDDGLKLVFHSDGTYETYEWYSNRWNLEGTGTWNYKNGVITARYYDEYEEEWVEEKTTPKTLNSTTLILESYGTDDGIEWYEKITYRKIANE